MIHVTVTVPEIERKLDEIRAMLKQIINKENQMAVNVKNIQDAVAAETTVEESAITLLNNLTAEIQKITTADPATQAALDALVAQINNSSTALAAAVAANTPAAPAPSPSPAP